MKKLFVGLLALSIWGLSASAFAQAGPDADMDGVPNDMDAFPCDAGPSAVSFFPGQGRFATLFFEDQWPSRGDNDFNDVVLAYNFILTTNAQGQVYQIRINYNALAIGGIFNNGLALHIPVPAAQVSSVTRQIGQGGQAEGLSPETTDPDLVIRLLDNVRQLYNNQAGTINSDPSQPALLGKPFEVVIRFTEPVTLDLSRVPFDTFIYRTQDFTHQIHRPEYLGTAAANALLFGSGDDGSSPSRHFVDRDGLPFALLLPASTPWPQEGTPISQLFPRIALFASTGGAQGADFYQSEVQLGHGWTQGSNGLAAPSPSFVGASDEPGNGACIVPWRVGGQQYGGSSNEATWQTFAADLQGNLLVAGDTTGTIPGGASSGGSDMFLAKFSPAGQLLWSRQAGSSMSETTQSIAVDSANNIYVAAFSCPQHPTYIPTLYKYSSDGTLLWRRTNPLSCSSFPGGLAIAPDGNVMMSSGCVLGLGPFPADLPYTSSVWGAVTAKLSATDGSLIWARAGDVASVNSHGISIAVDPLGNSYTYVCHQQGGHTLIKRGPNGELLYHTRTDDQPLWVAGQVRFAGDALVLVRPFAGVMNGVASNSGTWDYSVQKVSAADGHQIWMRAIGTSGTEYGYSSWAVSGANGLDSMGNIYVAGPTGGVFPGQRAYGGYDYFLAKLDPNGTVLWTNQFGTSGNDYATGAGWEPVSGQVYVGGFTTGSFAGSSNVGGTDIFLMKHNPVNGGVL